MEDPNEQYYVVKRVSVPISLEELMNGLTKEILKNQPKDIVLFASEYFAKLLKLRDEGFTGFVRARNKSSVIKLKSRKEKQDISPSKGDVTGPKKSTFESHNKPLSRQVALKVTNMTVVPKKIDHNTIVDDHLKRKRETERKAKATSNKSKSNFLSEKENVQGVEMQISVKPSTKSRTNFKRSPSKDNNKSKTLQNKEGQKKEGSGKSDTNAPDISVKKHFVPKNASIEEDGKFVKDGLLAVVSPRPRKKSETSTDNAVVTISVPVISNKLPDDKIKHEIISQTITDNIKETIYEASSNNKKVDSIKPNEDFKDNQETQEFYQKQKEDKNEKIGSKIQGEENKEDKTGELVSKKIETEAISSYDEDSKVDTISNQINQDSIENNDQNIVTAKKLPISLENQSYEDDYSKIKKEDSKITVSDLQKNDNKNVENYSGMEQSMPNKKKEIKEVTIDASENQKVPNKDDFIQKTEDIEEQSKPKATNENKLEPLIVNGKEFNDAIDTNSDDKNNRNLLANLQPPNSEANGLTISSNNNLTTKIDEVEELVTNVNVFEEKKKQIMENETNKDVDEMKTTEIKEKPDSNSQEGVTGHTEVPIKDFDKSLEDDTIEHQINDKNIVEDLIKQKSEVINSEPVSVKEEAFLSENDKTKEKGKVSASNDRSANIVGKGNMKSENEIIPKDVSICELLKDPAVTNIPSVVEDKDHSAEALNTAGDKQESSADAVDLSTDQDKTTRVSDKNLYDESKDSIAEKQETNLRKENIYGGKDNEVQTIKPNDSIKIADKEILPLDKASKDLIDKERASVDFNEVQTNKQKETDDKSTFIEEIGIKDNSLENNKIEENKSQENIQDIATDADKLSEKDKHFVTADKDEINKIEKAQAHVESNKTIECGEQLETKSTIETESGMSSKNTESEKQIKNNKLKDKKETDSTPEEVNKVPQVSDKTHQEVNKSFEKIVIKEEKEPPVTTDVNISNGLKHLEEGKKQKIASDSLHAPIDLDNVQDKEINDQIDKKDENATKSLANVVVAEAEIKKESYPNLQNSEKGDEKISDTLFKMPEDNKKDNQEAVAHKQEISMKITKNEKLDISKELSKSDEQIAKEIISESKTDVENHDVVHVSSKEANISEKGQEPKLSNELLPEHPINYGVKPELPGKLEDNKGNQVRKDSPQKNKDEVVNKIENKVDQQNTVNTAGVINVFNCETLEETKIPFGENKNGLIVGKLPTESLKITEDSKVIENPDKSQEILKEEDNNKENEHSTVEDTGKKKIVRMETVEEPLCLKVTIAPLIDHGDDKPLQVKTDLPNISEKRKELNKIDVEKALKENGKELEISTSGVTITPVEGIQSAPEDSDNRIGNLPSEINSKSNMFLDDSGGEINEDKQTLIDSASDASSVQSKNKKVHDVQSRFAASNVAENFIRNENKPVDGSIGKYTDTTTNNHLLSSASDLESSESKLVENNALHDSENVLSEEETEKNKKVNNVETSNLQSEKVANEEVRKRVNKFLESEKDFNNKRNLLNEKLIEDEFTKKQLITDEHEVKNVDVTSNTVKSLQTVSDHNKLVLIDKNLEDSKNQNKESSPQGEVSKSEQDYEKSPGVENKNKELILLKEYHNEEKHEERQLDLEQQERESSAQKQNKSEEKNEEKQFNPEAQERETLHQKEDISEKDYEEKQTGSENQNKESSTQEQRRSEEQSDSNNQNRESSLQKQSKSDEKYEDKQPSTKTQEKENKSEEKYEDKQLNKENEEKQLLQQKEHTENKNKESSPQREINTKKDDEATKEKSGEQNISPVKDDDKENILPINDRENDLAGLIIKNEKEVEENAGIKRNEGQKQEETVKSESLKQSKVDDDKEEKTINKNEAVNQNSDTSRKNLTVSNDEKLNHDEIENSNPEDITINTALNLDSTVLEMPGALSSNGKVENEEQLEYGKLSESILPDGKNEDGTTRDKRQVEMLNNPHVNGEARVDQMGNNFEEVNVNKSKDKQENLTQKSADKEEENKTGTGIKNQNEEVDETVGNLKQKSLEKDEKEKQEVEEKDDHEIDHKILGKETHSNNTISVKSADDQVKNNEESNKELRNSKSKKIEEKKITKKSDENQQNLSPKDQIADGLTQENQLLIIKPVSIVENTKLKKSKSVTNDKNIKKKDEGLKTPRINPEKKSIVKSLSTSTVIDRKQSYLDKSVKSNISTLSYPKKSHGNDSKNDSQIKKKERESKMYRSDSKNISKDIKTSETPKELPKGLVLPENKVPDEVVKEILLKNSHQENSDLEIHSKDAITENGGNTDSIGLKEFLEQERNYSAKRSMSEKAFEQPEQSKLLHSGELHDSIPVLDKIIGENKLQNVSEPDQTKLVHSSEFHDKVIIPERQILEHELNDSLLKKEEKILNAELYKKYDDISSNQSTSDQVSSELLSNQTHDGNGDVARKDENNLIKEKDGLWNSSRCTSVASDGTSSISIQTEHLNGTSLPLSVNLSQDPAGAAPVTSRSDESSTTMDVDDVGNDRHDVVVDEGDVAATTQTRELEGRAPGSATTSSPVVQQEMDASSNTRRNNASVAHQDNKNMEEVAATKIQASFRGYQVRKQLKTKNGGTEAVSQGRVGRRKNSGKLRSSDVSAVSKNIPPKKTNDVEERSATKIQAGIRGFLARRRFKKEKPGTPESS